MMAPASTSIVELLLHYGADPEVNAQGTSALDSARHYYPNVYKLFLFYPPLFKEAQEHPNQELLRECIEKECFTLSNLYQARIVCERTNTVRSKITLMLLHDKLAEKHSEEASPRDEPRSKKTKR